MNGTMKHIAFIFVFSTILLCSCGSKSIKDSQDKITAEMALEGVSNYCHSEYDWSMAKDNRRQTEDQPSLLEDGRGAKEENEVNPDIMGVEIGEETDSTIQVVFRSYTGALVNFYVNKESGTTRMEEYVPSLDIKEEAGTIDLFEYLKKE